MSATSGTRRQLAGHCHVHWRDRHGVAASELLDAGGDHGGHDHVASYLAPNGHYADDQNYFTSQYNSGSLHVPANGGVYAYCGTGSFPTQVWNASNYWVDVVFTTAL